MCGRYTLIASAEKIEKTFKLEPGQKHKPRYNAAPTQLMPVITNTSPNGLSFFYWGLIPSWSHNKSVSPKLINARSETLLEKASFVQAFSRRRCLIPSDGFYEWKVLGKKTKIPYRIGLKDTELFAFAGLWDEFEDEEGEMMHTFTIITTPANEAINSIHDRMPAILGADDYSQWLDRQLPEKELIELLRPYPSEKMYMHTVSHMVNSPVNDSPELIKPTPPTDQKGNYTLFG
ncbi:MAG: SOS response-associated peptidase [Cyclobacteriaceae bacterium]|nr:SOS response-associated peptidase [Cyclobacteriaceae bacterium]